MRQASVDKKTFVAGEKVFLADGPYQCTLGTFIGLRADTSWADVQEANGKVRIHPVIWLQHCPDGDLVWRDLMQAK